MKASAALFDLRIGQLQPKYAELLQAYLDYLIFLQQQESAPAAASKAAIETPRAARSRRAEFKKFRGDAPFPNLTVAENEYYEQ